MNIPEGWPTEEMLFAASEACDDMFQGDFIRAFKAAIEAAPTPPAQNDWQQAVLNECMAIEGCYREADPTGTVKCLIDWHVANEREPAQDEPVAVVDESDDGKFADLLLEGTFLKKGTKLYARPQSDKLRKAAEEVAKRINNYVSSRGELSFDEAWAIHGLLRAALEEK